MTTETLSLALQSIALAASAIIFWRTEPIINLMGPRCRYVVRLAFWFLAVGSAALMVVITQGYRPSLPVVLSLCGTALLLASERRIKSMLRLHSITPPAEDRRNAAGH